LKKCLCIVWLALVCMGDAQAQLFACEASADTEAPPKCCKWKCECDIGPAGNRRQACHTVCNYPEGAENNEDLQNELRCMMNDSPIRGESAAWIKELTCGYHLTEQKVEPLATEVSIGACARPAVAQVHTHPFQSSTGQKISPKPSAGDRAAAAKCNVPVYVLSNDQIWKVLPDGTIVQVASDGWRNKGCMKKP
jgi:hypothetical protein